MATAMPRSYEPFSFDHPVAGPSRADFSILAVRWRDGAGAAARAQLLASLGLSLLQLEDARTPLPRINQTDGLSWVTAQGQPIAGDAIDALEASALVTWVMPALRPERAAATSAAAGAEHSIPVPPAYTVNPQRMYVRQQAFDRSGGLLGAGLSARAQAPQRLRGWVTVELDTPRLAQGRNAAQMAPTLAQSLGSTADVRFETIPLYSPATHGGAVAHAGPRPAGCRPPTGEFTPDDPLFGQQWGLMRVGAPRAWEMVRATAAVTVAVIDEGVQLDHPDLLLHPQSWNASSDTPDGSPTGNHGTACAGIIAARMDNASGVAGIAGGARILAVATATWADIDIAEGLYFAADQGARIVSMSFGVYAAWGFWDFDLIRDALQYCADQDMLLVAAAGNENGNEARFPGSDARTLCVGGSNRSDERKRIGDSSSEAWWGASYGPDIDVVAPCLEMPTTDRLGGDGYTAGDFYDHFNGTSSATPLVAGLAALVLSLRPGLGAVALRSLIERSCDKISPALYTYANVAGKPSGTWHEEVGYGRVNAERALLLACEHEVGAGDTRCSGCGGDCIEPTPAQCRAPEPVPWLPFDRCMYFYESRVFDGSAGLSGQSAFGRLRLRVTYQHCLQLVGRQQGPLLFTTTLLPGEEVRLYEYDRYRRTKAESERVTVHASFRQTVSALSQTRRSSASSTYVDTLVDIRTHADTSVSAGGGLAGFFGAPTVKGEAGVDTETSVASGGSVRTASEQFTQFAVTASQATEAERATVVSTFEEAEHVSTTARQLKNHNPCFAVTYFVRRVNEVYRVHSRIVAAEWRLGDSAPWRSVDDLADLPDALREAIAQLLKQLLRDGREAQDSREITLPTDGLLYEPELAHCSSCEPMKMAEEQIKLEQLRLQARKACLEVELLALELERQRGTPQALAGAA